MRNALARLPLTGGLPEVVLVLQGDYWPGSGVCAGCFVHHGATGYFPFDDKIYRILPEGTEAEIFADIAAFRLAAGADKLYVESEGGIWALDYETGESENIATEDVYDEIQVSGEYLYAIDEGSASSVYLVRKLLPGGPWTRIAPRRTAAYTWRLQVLDDTFFYDLHNDDGWQLVQGKLSAPAEAGIALALREPLPLRRWIGTHHGIFWNDGNRVMRVPLAVE